MAKLYDKSRSKVKKMYPTAKIITAKFSDKIYIQKLIIVDGNVIGQGNTGNKAYLNACENLCI